MSFKYTRANHHFTVFRSVSISRWNVAGESFSRRGHAYERIRSEVRFERCLVSVFRCDQDLPVSRVCVQGTEDLRVIQAVDTFVHPGDRVRVENRYRIKFPVVYAEPLRNVFLWCEHNRSCPITRWGGNCHPLLHHPVHLGFFDVTHANACQIRY